jgi:hypothetical protein
MAIATGTALALGAGAAAGGALYSGSQSARASKRAASVQAEAAEAARRQSAQQFAQTRADLAPYRQAGTEALDLYRNMVLGGDMSQFQASPGYQFRLGQGVEALERGAAARGGLFSGAQQKALTRFGQDIGSDEYQNYLNQLFNLQQQGLGATTQTGQFGQFSTQAQNLARQQGAQAYGQGILGGAQGRSQAVGGALGAFGQGLGAYAGYKAGYNPYGGR